VKPKRKKRKETSNGSIDPEVKIINHKKGYSQFQWPINLCNLFNEQDVTILN